MNSLKLRSSTILSYQIRLVFVQQNFDMTKLLVSNQTLSSVDFDGTPEKCISFHDAFETLVSSQNATYFVKFMASKSCLSGPPLDLLRGYDLNGVNYQDAWNRLLKQCRSPKLQPAALWTKLTSLTPARKQSPTIRREIKNAERNLPDNEFRNMKDMLNCIENGIIMQEQLDNEVPSQ